MQIIAGLGNPGEEYEGTRHNTGRIVLEAVRKKFDFDEFSADKKFKALVSEGKVGKEKILLLEPETFMNKSGESVAVVVDSPKKAENLVVIYDDMDLPVGSLKISFDRGSGGHKGLESVAKSVKTTAFTRIRIGVSPETASGKIKKPSGEDGVIKFILGKFSESEMKKIKAVSKTAAEAVEMIILEGREKAMGEFNGR